MFFNFIYDIFILLLISWRGVYGNDVVEYDIIGEKFIDLFDLVDIFYKELDYENFEGMILDVFFLIEKINCFVVILIKDEI